MREDACDYYLTDALGSTIALTPTGGGGVSMQYAYGPNGELAFPAHGSPPYDLIGVTGMLALDGSGLVDAGPSS